MALMSFLLLLKVQTANRTRRQQPNDFPLEKTAREGLLQKDGASPEPHLPRSQYLLF